MAARVIFSGKSGAPFFSYLTTDAPGIGAFFGSGNIAERKKVVKRAKRDRREKWRKGDEAKGERELDCAGIFEDISPRGKTDITLINNACLRPPG